MKSLTEPRTPPAAGLPEPWIDWGKAIASQLIVWHHLAHYGPLAPRVAAVWPDLMGWLDGRALYAVQAFLVMGGYLAARSLWPRPGAPRVAAADWPARAARRWRRLMPTYLAALLLAVLCAALARQWMDDPDTPAAPTAGQLLAHLLLLQDLLEQPALSAGLWYVAIDLQLYALLAALALLVGRAPARWRRASALALVVGGGAASVLVFNRQPGGDELAPYFFGSYALGVLAAWGRAAGTAAGRRAAGALLLGLAGAGLALAWRDRLALAALCAMLLLWQPGRTRLALAGQPWLRSVVAQLAAISYAVFLLHYPISLLVTALLIDALPAGPVPAAALLVLTWLLSLATGWALTQALQAPGLWQRLRRLTARWRHGTR
ncbi:MAG TPA: acyltransferase family protein [Ottowia sp.]|nr:acyltransferase family protein [Ottowia sp.]